MNDRDGRYQRVRQMLFDGVASGPEIVVDDAFFAALRDRISSEPS